MGRRKPHHTHEIGDAYAEGWAARRAWTRGFKRPANPYEAIVAIANKAKQSEARQATQLREVQQWTDGWNDCEEDLRRGDLDEVTDFDFRRLSKW